MSSLVLCILSLDKLLDTKASLADLQDKLTKLSEEKRFLEKAMPVAPVTVIEAPKNGSGSKDRGSDTA